MGCASSSPLVESGKNLVDTAKESAGDAIGKGEMAVQEVGETVKEKFSSEMEHVKEAMQSAMTTAENSIGSVMGKVGNSISSTASDVKEAVNHAEDEAEDALNVASESATEAVSEAETVLASEAENVKETFSTMQDEAFEKLDSGKEVIEDHVDGVTSKVKDVLEIEDIDEHFDGLGDSVNNVENKVEEIVTKLPTPAISPMKEPKKEEPPPTFWEAAADAILHRSFSKSIDLCDNDPDKERILVELLLIEPKKENNVEDGSQIDDENPSESKVHSNSNGNDSQSIFNYKDNVYIHENKDD